MAKDYRRLWGDVTSTNDEGKAVRTLADILLDSEGRVFILRLACKDAELCIEILNHGLAEHNLKTTEKQAFFVALRRLATIHGRFPDSMMITDEIKVSGKIVASGGFADVRIGTYKGHFVAVKTMRVAEHDSFLEIRKQFCKEVVLWNTLSHPNVLKLIGVQGDMDKGQFITVSEWMVHGNVMEYIRKNSVNRLELLHGAAQGLKYLHGASLAHGDLKGANILMSNDNPPRACLADFAFMTMVLDSGQPMSCSAQLDGDTMMFMSPELLVPSKFRLKNSLSTPEADIYAFGLVTYQVLTGGLPFPGLVMAEIARDVIQGVRPTKPKNASAIGFSDPLWSLAQRCWDDEMEARPKVVEVVSQLGRAAANWDGVMPPCAKVESVVSASQDPTSDSTVHCGIFGPSSGIVSESPTESQTISTGFDPLSTQCTESPSVATESRGQPDQDLISIDRIDRMLDSTVCDRDRHELLNTLCKLCSRQQTIPKSMHMVNCLQGELVEECDGGYATVFRGKHKGRAVAIKILRLYLTSDLDKCFRGFIREAVAWRHLRHPNILPLLGVNMDLEKYQLAMISEWMVHGNINEYVERCEGVNRVQLLADAANGLEYMHGLRMVHGDLKGANILINKSHRGCLADFGLSTIVSVGDRAAASNVSLMSFTDGGGTIRWMSPELLDPDRFGISDSRPTKQSDCYALGMIVYEVLCGNAPYWETTNEAAVINTITNGGRPQKPEAAENLGFTNQLWELVEQCWSADVSTRPDISAILSHLNHATWSWDRRQMV